jgi:hypothetical protein
VASEVGLGRLEVREGAIGGSQGTSSGASLNSTNRPLSARIPAALEVAVRISRTYGDLLRMTLADFGRAPL